MLVSNDENKKVFYMFHHSDDPEDIPYEMHAKVDGKDMEGVGYKKGDLVLCFDKANLPKDWRDQSKARYEAKLQKSIDSKAWAAKVEQEKDQFILNTQKSK